MTTVNIEIDGKKVEARNGSMLIEAADEVGIDIPRFCYHKKLSIAANCRMCLVEVEKAAKPLPACATPVTDGMKVFTRSPKAINAQKGVMEFLLINHPLDCPICDQGGECELQDIAVGYGDCESKFYENKRIVTDKDIGPLISTDMTRCIHCTRCVRFGDEIAGVREMGSTGRGEHMEIGTYVAGTISSEVSANVIDLCPVGALTSKPYRYSARAWELGHAPTVAAHDCLGSNASVHTKDNEIQRVVPRENDHINESWISDRDRFSYEGANSSERLTQPMIKIEGEWQETDWNTALENASRGLQSVIDSSGSEQLGCLISPNSTIEELYLSQKLVRGLGGNNIDHRLRQNDFSDQMVAPSYPYLGRSIESLEELDGGLLIGSNVRKEQPIAALKLRSASMNGAQFCALNSVDYDFNFTVSSSITTTPNKMVDSLASIAKSVLEAAGVSPSGVVADLIKGAVTDDTSKAIADSLSAATKSAVILGSSASFHPQASTLRALASVIAETTSSTIGQLTDGCNSAGAWLAGAIPHRLAGAKKSQSVGHTAKSMLGKPLKGYLLVGIEPELDCLGGSSAEDAISNADYTVALTAFRSDSLDKCANVLLPITPLTETSGSLINVEGVMQTFSGVVAAKGDSRPAWKVLRVMGNLFDVDGFEYISNDEVTREVESLISSVKPGTQVSFELSNSLSAAAGIQITSEYAVHSGDAQVRRSASLQQTDDAINCLSVQLNERTAEDEGVTGCSNIQLTQGEREINMPMVINNRVADSTLLVYSGLPQTSGLAADFSPITIKKA